ncbi:hypothetical protein [Massilia endophytica]|uniref:hypothetical protein n=1 Tax=Massilia endophytica TaxID=2899220 RepID=UPI001E304087|nr:hypothetical protein [Massilia endophytica]UGQ46798.1 hypothetical protein LSQ66_24065 [Massilia endophytica]
MKLHHILAASLLAMSLAAAPARAADDASHFLLTRTLVNKLVAMEAESKRMKAEKDDEDSADPETVEDLVRVLEKDKRAKAMLAKHGISTREFASATFAMMHAGFFVAFEPSMDKKKAAQTLAGYTKEQQANIALVRSMNLAKN